MTDHQEKRRHTIALLSAMVAAGLTMSALRDACMVVS